MASAHLMELPAWLDLDALVAARAKVHAACKDRPQLLPAAGPGTPPEACATFCATFICAWRTFWGCGTRTMRAEVVQHAHLARFSPA